MVKNTGEPPKRVRKRAASLPPLLLHPEFWMGRHQVIKHLIGKNLICMNEDSEADLEICGKSRAETLRAFCGMKIQKEQEKGSKRGDTR